MAKKPMRLFITVLFIALIASSAYASLMPNVQAAEITTHENSSQNQITGASVNNSNAVLSDYLIRYLDSLSKQVNSSELDRIRHQMIDQETRNRDRIKSTNGTVLKFTPPDSPLDSLTIRHLATIEFTSPPADIGYIENAGNLIGPSDVQYAHLHTDGWNEDPNNPMGGEAFAAGYMTAPAIGDVYLQCRIGPHSGDRPPWEDYVMAFTSNDINTPLFEWDYLGIGYEQVSSSSWTSIYFGTAETTFSCLAVACWTPPPPGYQYPDYFNCVEIDCVTAVTYTPPQLPYTLSISTSGEGYTSPSGNHQYEANAYAHVEAFPYSGWAFDYWLLDEGNAGSYPSIDVYMDNNHELQAVFYQLDSVSAPSVGGPTSGDISTSYEFSASSTDSQAHTIQYTFDWGDSSAQTVTEWYSSGATAYASHSWGSGGIYSVTVKAQCSNGAWSSWSSPHTINIGNQPVYHWLSVTAMDSQYQTPLYPNIYIDSNWAGTGYASVQVLEGWHTILVDDPVWNDYLQCYDYLWRITDDYGNGASRPVYSDTEIYALYLPQ